MTRVENLPEHRRRPVEGDIHPRLVSWCRADPTVRTPTVRTLALMVSTAITGSVGKGGFLKISGTKGCLFI
jgi:hypothetical protein